MMLKKEEEEEKCNPDQPTSQISEAKSSFLYMILIMAYVPVVFTVVLFIDGTLALLALLLFPLLAVVYLHIMAGTFWRNRCRKAAERVGLEYYPFMGDDQRVFMAFRAFSDYLNMMKKGEQNSVYDIFYGTYHGHQLFVFNLGITHVAGIIRLDRSFPELRIWPEKGPSGYMGKHFDLPEIDMDNLDFSRMYKIKCRSRQFAFAFLSPKMMELLMYFRKFSRMVLIEIERDTLFVAEVGGIKPKYLEMQLDRLLSVREAIPEYLFSDDNDICDWMEDMKTET